MIKRHLLVLTGSIILIAFLVTLICMSVNRHKWTSALFEAIEAHDAPAVQIAIDHGANVNAYRHLLRLPNLLMFNDTPLILACRSGDGDIIELLLQTGADVNKADNLTGNTPLIQIVHAGTPNRFSIAKQLITHGADVLVERQSGFNVLDGTIVMMPDDDSDTREEGFILFQYLVKSGVPLSVSFSKESALTCAAHYNNYNVVQFLVDNQYFLVDERDDMQDTALIVAARVGDTEMVELLLGFGADKTLTDAEGKTAYDYAQENQSRELIEVLG
jgi:ankyrin repeat protein